MPALTGPRAALLAGLVACVLYLNAFGNGWAVDDDHLVRDNPASQSIGAAFQNFFEPYWPQLPEGRGGLYRPLVVVSYGLDWTISGGHPGWFHVTNVAMHGIVTALVVLVFLAWLPPLGALVTGLLFAVHPVHVEAVANVVGRAEIMAAGGMLLAVLAARQYRRSHGRSAAWFGATLLATMAAMLSKEHGVATIVVLGIDQWLDRTPSRRSTVSLYLAVLGLTLGYLYLWRAVASVYALETVAAAIRGLTPAERIATAVPAQLDIVRLLVWPMQLAVDYNPLVVPQRTEWGLHATLAALTSGAMLALAVALARRAPAVSFGILAGAITLVPTSNIVFSAGILLAERTLYFAVLAPAATLGFLVSRPVLPRPRRLLLLATGVLLLVFSGRAFLRTPVWRSTLHAVTQDMLTYPQNYRVRFWMGTLRAMGGDSTRAIAEYLTASELFEDPFITRKLVPLATKTGRHRLAAAEAARAYRLAPDYPEIARFLVEALLELGEVDSAMTVARNAAETSPGSGMVNDIYRDVLTAIDAPRWQLLLTDARTDWIGYRLGRATARLDSAATALAASPRPTGLCWELRRTEATIANLQPDLLERFGELARDHDLDCVPNGES